MTKPMLPWLSSMRWCGSRNPECRLSAPLRKKNLLVTKEASLLPGIGSFTQLFVLLGQLWKVVCSAPFSLFKFILLFCSNAWKFQLSLSTLWPASSHPPVLHRERHGPVWDGRADRGVRGLWPHEASTQDHSRHRCGSERQALQCCWLGLHASISEMLGWVMTMTRNKRSRATKRTYFRAIFNKVELEIYLTPSSHS